MRKNSLLLCGILSSFYYAAINIIVPLQDPGYDIVNQTVSELSALDAPTRTLWVTLCIFYSLLLLAFAWGIWRSAGHQRPLRLVAILMGIYGFSGFFWPPMHLREVLAAGGGSMTDTMHLVFAGLTVFMMILMMIFGAMAFGKTFRMFTLVSIILLMFFGALTGIQGPMVDNNLPTPLIGVWERINIGMFMLWVAVFGKALINKANTISGDPEVGHFRK